MVPLSGRQGVSECSKCLHPRSNGKKVERSGGRKELASLKCERVSGPSLPCILRPLTPLQVGGSLSWL